MESGADGARRRALELAAGWMLRRKALQNPCRRMLRMGVGAVAVKGWDLAQTVYPFLGARPMGDVDLMVPAPQLAEAAGAFRACGWRALSPGWGLLSSETVSELKLASERGVLVELHTHPFYYPALFPGRAFRSLSAPERSVEPDLGAPSWPAALAMLLVHALTESEVISRQWVDIAAVCPKLSGSEEWRELCLWLRRSGLGAAAGELLEAAAEMDAPVPRAALTSLSAGPDRRRVLAAIRARHGLPTAVAVLLGGWRGLSLGAAQLHRIVFRGGPLRAR